MTREEEEEMYNNMELGPAINPAPKRIVAAGDGSTPSAGYTDAVELHTDGTPWIACSPRSPKPGKTWEAEGKQCRVYHPDAIEFESGYYGADSHYKCPNCGDTWWVERDG
jgi:hypothetical protein